MFVWLALRRVDFDATWRAFGNVRWWVVPVSLAVLAVGVWLRALRWQALFVPEARPPLGATTRALLVGLLFNILLPARAGEAVRVLLLARETGASRAEVLATAVAERIYDVGALLLLLLVAAPFLPRVSWLSAAAVVAGIAAAALVALVAVLLRYGDRPVAFLLRLAPFISDERAAEIASSLVRGLASLHRPSIAVRALTLTVVSWLVLAASTLILLRGFHFGATLGFGAALLITVATNLAMVIPSSPGGVGPFEGGVIVALSVYAIDRSPALSFALLLHAVNLVPLLITGYAALQLHTAVLRRRATTAALSARAAGSST